MEVVQRDPPSQEVIADMVRCLERLDCPRDRLEALILVERREVATKCAIAAADRAELVRVVVLPGKPQTNPRSRNAGLLTKEDLIVIYDVDDPSDPGQLRLVAAHFLASDDKLGLRAGQADDQQRQAELPHPPVRAGVSSLPGSSNFVSCANGQESENIINRRQVPEAWDG